MSALTDAPQKRKARATAPATRERTPLPGRRRPSLSGQVFLLALVIYFFVPLWWLLVASTKSTSALFNGSAGALWFDQNFNLFDNIAQLVQYNNGEYLRWMANSALYALVGGGGATVLAVLAGYGLAKYRFRGRTVSFAILLGSVMVPSTALVIPTFVLLSQVGWTNTIWAVILPSLLNPFGVYLMRVYTQDAIPDELLDAARVDGAGEYRTFVQVCLPLLRPAIVTVFLLSVVSTWNNYFLPLAMLNDSRLFPITVGLGVWQGQAIQNSGGQQIWNLMITGAFLSIIPLIVAFLSLQKYWRGGLSLGSVK
ncbi:carbohydrate ABC transporter permease [Agromyces silvae]|uniref:carbohydrate ABC transporter permease n=1 Tax=Agromyces silvae TaxID=3388266 RepID=UPI00280A79E4|nr:carbohydrate ABC transporter permease [Agromyces protaetiae]